MVCKMKFLSALAEYQAREFFAHRECLLWAIHHNCQLREDAHNLYIFSNFSGECVAMASNVLSGDERVDTPFVGLLRSLYRSTNDSSLHSSLVVALLDLPCGMIAVA